MASNEFNKFARNTVIIRLPIVHKTVKRRPVTYYFFQMYKYFFQDLFLVQENN